MTTVLNQAQSRSLVIQLNLAKLLALAVLVPAATVGISQRAVEMVPDDAQAGLVAVTTTVGACCGIVGAVLFGRFTDRVASSVRGRWWCVVVGASSAGVGITLMMFASTPWMLVIGWGAAQIGCSGAMSVIRAMLGFTQPTQRRRGATVMIALTYLGAFIPILILIVFPNTVWETSLVLALLAIAIPLLAAVRSGDLNRFAAYTPDAAPESQFGGAHRTGRVPRERSLPWPVVLLTQCGLHVTLSAYLAYHALDIAESARGDWESSATQMTLLTLAAALLGLLLTSTVLLIRPALLGSIPRLLILSGVVLMASIALRPYAQGPELVVLLFLSGVAVALTSASLLLAALSAGLKERLGQRIGLYSAVTPIGQLAGPPLGLLIIHVSPEAAGYNNLFLVVACIPLFWSILVFVTQRRISADVEPAARDRVESCTASQP